MNTRFQNILSFIEQDKTLSAEEKNALLKSLQDADKEFEITSFKLDRTEKVKRTTAILLEETIEELEQKRKAVEAQNRELEIESSLERVRTVAMSMNKPDDMLDVCKTIALQLQLLGVKEIRNVQTAIFYRERGFYMNYEFYAKHDKTFVTETVYTNHEVATAFAEQMFKGKGEVYTTHIKDNEVKNWLAYQKSTNVFIDSYLENATSLSYYWHSLGAVALGISTYTPLSDEALQLFQRFLKVFDLSYRRYLDIEKAIAQAKEAQIETSLERVRAQAMAMRTPEDLTGICEVLYAELHTLGFTEARNAMINIYDDEKRTFVNYDYSDAIGKSVNHLHYNIHPVIEKQIKQLRSAGEPFSETYFKGKDLEDMKAFRKSIGEPDDPRIDNTEALYYYFYSIGTGAIGISTFSGITEEKLNVLKRFRNVFNLSYQRYTDIALAEVQAKEAKIELALERVRSRSLAMHNTSELQEVIHTVHKELLNLDIAINGGSFIAINSDIDKTLRCWGAGGTADTSQEVLLPLYEKPFCSNLINRIKKEPGFFTEEFTQQEKKDFFTFLFKYEPWSQLDANQKNETLSSPGGYTRSCCVSQHTTIFIINHLGEKFSTADNDILQRFAKVFEQTYTRFLDLQKAEAQAREGQIQLALERVRAKTMAMQHSDELREVVATMYEQLQLLDINYGACTIVIMDAATGNMQHWVGGFAQKLYPESYQVNYFKHPFIDTQLAQWKNGEEYAVIKLSGENKKAYDAVMFSKTDFKNFPEATKQWMATLDPVVFSIAYMTHGALTWGPEELTEEYACILQRFAKVFEQTYTRFLDLQKAEAQAKEAQIETALERVRARTMGMQKSEELKEVIKIVYQQIRHLNIHLDHAGFVIDYTPKGNWHFWIADEQDIPSKISHPYFESVWATQFNEAKENGADFFATHLNFEEKNKFYKELLSYVPGLPQASKEFYLNCPGLAASTVLLDNIGLYIENFSGTPYTDEENITLMRFGKVFEQTYTRFLDLQKAEAQSREAQIQLALERGRTQSMIMQHSKELDDTLRVFHEQILLLGINSAFSFLWLPDEEKSNHIFWAAWAESNDDATVFKSKAITYPLDRNEPATAQCLIDWKSGEPVVSYPVPPEAVEVYFAAWQELIDGVEKLTPAHFTNGLYYVEAFMKYGCFGVMLESDLDENEKKILNRFAVEFERAYTRFLDLQKAEAQAKEAQIEAALEKVRSRTMAMQNSNELQETAVVLFNEFKKLGTDNVYQVTIGIYNEAEGLVDFRVTNWAGSGEQENRSFLLDMTEPTVVKPSVAAWKANKKSLVIDLTGEALEGWINYRNKMSGVTISSKDTEGRRVISIAYFSKGHISISSALPVPQETIKTLERFAAVFDGTYTRFLDLEKAEAQAKEAQIEAALERVRSRTLAMQKSDELAETAAEVFRQLISLGIEPNRLYIGIVKEETGDMEMWATDEDGTHVGKKFMFNKNENISVKKLFDGWKAKEKSVIVDMQGKELEDYFDYLNNVMHIPFKGGLTQKRRVQSVAYFSKGFIGMASPDGQGDETIQLLERFAAVFNLTFTRFNDLKIAEAHAQQAEEDLIAIKDAKQKAEAALTELQSTQKQLIQSEKMASLGELTAGIAHEIQNPLNFVNNFSEVSKELLDEMREAIDKGDTAEAKEIMNDVIQNLEKINHHGKRADGIVKGMLQHSRSSSAGKEPTDINKLADEYLRLAYHGLRAKDKSFNATLKTDYDETIEKANIIPQDIGRVILNLITNAFYAVGERKKASTEKSGFENLTSLYDPAVSVTTKKMGDKVLITVADNGNGIPKNILDKIFQPFFTTKPTGQGTGLGLSLAYDIVKAHGGELKVETKVDEGNPDDFGKGEGTTFIIQLPIN